MRRFIANKANLFTLCFFLGFLLLCIVSFILSVTTAGIDANGEVVFQPLLITLFSISLVFVGLSFLVLLVLVILHLVRKKKMKRQ
ncbi:MAG: hypothetical protein J6038_04810 [Bacilli bacterium]|nr:hypothetical protein [Bacilli bacterium]